MGYIEKRGKNSWRIVSQVKVGDTMQPVRMTLRMDPSLPESIQRRDAQRELEKLERRLAGEASGDYTVRQWSEIWLTKHLDDDASPVTVYNYRYLLSSRILPQLGGYLLTDLSPAILTDWMHQLRHDKRKSTRMEETDLKRPRRSGEKLITESQQNKPLSVKTVLLYYGCVKTMLAAAVRQGILEYNPMERVQRPKKRKKKVKTLPETDIRYLLQLIFTEAPQQLRLSVLLAMLCGLRLGEVGALQYWSVNWDQETISISQALKYTPDDGAFIAGPKTDAGDRVITLPHSMIRILHDAMWDDVMMSQEAMEDDPADLPEHMTTREKKAAKTAALARAGAQEWQTFRWIIHNRYGCRVNKDTPSKWFRTFADAHGFQGVTYHDLRHVHASILLAQHMDLASVSARMGHSDPSVTLRVYADALPPRDQDSAATMDNLLTEVVHPTDLSAEDPDEGSGSTPVS